MVKASKRVVAVFVGLVIGAAVVTALPGNAYATVSSGWLGHIVEAAGSTGMFMSMAIDPADGNPSMAFSDFTNDRTVFAHWNGSSWDKTTIGDGTGPVALTYDAAGNANAAYCGATSTSLIYAELNGSAWETEVVDDRCREADVSLAYDDSGNPGITYGRRQGRTGYLILARKSGGSWQKETLAVTKNRHSFVFKNDGYPAVAYAGGDANIHFMEWNGSAWSDESFPGNDPVLRLDPIGELAMCYHLYDTSVRFARYDGASWTHETVQPVNLLYGSCDLGFDSAGNAFFSFLDFEAEGSAYFAERLGANSYDVEMVDHFPTGIPMWGTAIAVTPAGTVGFGYGDYFNNADALYAEKIGSCSSNADCDDSNLCTSDVCNNGTCEYGAAVSCDDGDACTVDSCDPNTGQCNPSAPLDCDDGDPCTIDSCDTQTGCVHDPDPQCDCGASGDPCTDDGDCCSGRCRGKPGQKTCN